MVKTRSMKLAVRRLYRGRVKSSACRGKSFTKCRIRNGCRRTIKGRIKSYCRKRSNRHI